MVKLICQAGYQETELVNGKHLVLLLFLSPGGNSMCILGLQWKFAEYMNE